MKIFFSTFIFALLFGYFPSLCQGPDTVWTLKKEGIDYVKFSPDGKKIYASCYKSITEIESSTGKILRNFDSVNFPLGPMYMEITKDGKYVLTAGASYNIFAWNTETGESLGEVNYQRVIYGKHNFTIHPIEHQLYFGSKDTLILFDLDSSKVVFSKIITDATIIKMKASNDNKYLAILLEYYNYPNAKYQKKIQIVDTKNFSVIRELSANILDLLSFDFSNDSKYLSYVSTEDLGCCVYIFNFETNLLNKFTSRHFNMSAFNAKFVTPNNLLLVSGTYEKYDAHHTLIYDFNQEKILYDIPYTGVYNCLDVSISNNIILSSIGQPRILYFFNDNWYKTDVPISFSGDNLSVNYRSNYIFINNPEEIAINKIQIYDVLGALINEINNPDKSIPFSAPSGVYLVRVVTGEKDYGFKIAVGE